MLVLLYAKGRIKYIKKNENFCFTKSKFHNPRTRKTRTDPSTSQQAAVMTITIDSVNNEFDQRPAKPFVKFKDNERRKTRFKECKRNKSPNENTFEKIIRKAKERPNSVSCKVRSIPDSIENPSTSKQKSPVPTQLNAIKTNENESSDDDCIYLEPELEVITIADETIIPTCSAKPNGTHQRNEWLKDYVPIGTKQLRRDNASIKLITSTPKLKLLSDRSPSRVPFYTVSPINKNTASVEESDNDNDVVVIDDSITINDADQTKAERQMHQRTSEESVIFIGEEKSYNTRTPTPPAFIPLETPSTESHYRIVPNHVTAKETKRQRNDLFTSKEQRQLSRYNSNAYNPNKDNSVPVSKKRMVIIDGSNVAYNHALNKEFSVKGLKICLDYFEKIGHEVKAVVPQFRLQKQKSSDPEYLERLHKEGKIVFTPCKSLPGKSSISYDDRFVLQLAAELDAAVVSNDNYRDLIHENSAFKKIIENRVIGYTWCNDLFILPKDPYGKWGPTLADILNRS